MRQRRQKWATVNGTTRGLIVEGRDSVLIEQHGHGTYEHLCLRTIKRLDIAHIEYHRQDFCDLDCFSANAELPVDET